MVVKNRVFYKSDWTTWQRWRKFTLCCVFFSIFLHFFLHNQKWLKMFLHQKVTTKWSKSSHKCTFVCLKLTLVVLLSDCSHLQKTKRVELHFFSGEGVFYPNFGLVFKKNYNVIFIVFVCFKMILIWYSMLGCFILYLNTFDYVR